jgi:hypothetical protein
LRGTKYLEKNLKGWQNDSSDKMPAEQAQKKKSCKEKGVHYVYL